MKKRYILFGYQIQTGNFSIVLEEAAAVKYIFAPAVRLTIFPTVTGTKILSHVCFPAIHTVVQPTIRPLSQKTCIIKYSRCVVKKPHPAPASYSPFVTICNAVAVVNDCTGSLKHASGTAVIVECGQMQFHPKNYPYSFVKRYLGFACIRIKFCLQQAPAIFTPSNPHD